MAGTAKPDLSMLLLKRVCGLESIAYDDEGLELISRMGGGHPRDLLNFLDHVQMLGGATAGEVRDALGLDCDAVSRYFLATFAGDVRQYVEVLRQWPDQPAQKLNLIRQFLLFLEYQFLGLDLVVNPRFQLIPPEQLDQLGESLRSFPGKLGMTQEAFGRELRDIWRQEPEGVTATCVEIKALLFHRLLHCPPLVRFPTKPPGYSERVPRVVPI